MAREIQTIANLDRRLPEHGRIRIGEKQKTKGGKEYPSKLDAFRFTSHDTEAIKQIADLYGGKPQSWERGQWEVKTEAKEIPVVLPPDPLGGTPIYEFWSKGGVQRRCDGEICWEPQTGRDGVELVDVPCKCVAEDRLLCKPTTRLTVVLPDIKFGGGWRLESNGWNVAKEMPGMVGAIQEFAARGFTRATLALEQRKDVFGGQTRQYVVPVLRPTASIEAMLEGGGALRALAPGSPLVEIDPPDDLQEDSHTLPLHGATTVDTSWEDDDVIVDAEIVDEGEGPPSSPSSAQHDVTDEQRPFIDEGEELERARRQLHASLREIGMGTEERHALARRVSAGRTASSAELTLEELRKVILAVKAVRAGKAELQIEDGIAKVVQV